MSASASVAEISARPQQRYLPYPRCQGEAGTEPGRARYATNATAQARSPSPPGPVAGPVAAGGRERTERTRNGSLHPALQLSRTLSRIPEARQTHAAPLPGPPRPAPLLAISVHGPISRPKMTLRPAYLNCALPAHVGIIDGYPSFPMRGLPCRSSNGPIVGPENGDPFPPSLSRSGCLPDCLPATASALLVLISTHT